MVNYICPKCNKNFTNKSKYTRHINRIIPCISSVKKNALKKIHVQKSPMNRISVQNRCNETSAPDFFAPDQVRSDQKICDKTKFFCNICSKKFSRNYTLKRHILRTHIDILQSFFPEVNDFKDEKKFKQEIFRQSKTFLSRAKHRTSDYDLKKQVQNPVQNGSGPKKIKNSEKKNLTNIVRIADLKNHEKTIKKNEKNDKFLEKNENLLKKNEKLGRKKKKNYKNSKKNKKISENSDKKRKKNIFLKKNENYFSDGYNNSIDSESFYESDNSSLSNSSYVKKKTKDDESTQTNYTDTGEAKYYFGERIFQCGYCNKIYKNVGHLRRHKQECVFINLLSKQNISVDKYEDKNKTDLILELETAKNKIEALNKNNIIYNTNNITLMAYNKKPDLSHLTDNDYLRIMDKGFKSVPKLIEAIHFHPKKPENQNIYIPNIKNKYAMIWNGEKWDLINRKDIIDDMYDDGSNILIEKMEELENSNIEENIKRKFRRFIEKKEEENIKSMIKEDIKLLLYNKKEVIRNVK